MKPFHPDSNDFDFINGKVILIDKPLEWTSFDVVNKIRYKLTHSIYKKKIKVGHAGTLDPLATGLLIVCTGKFTKKINEFQDQDKVYTGTFYLGATTPTYDRESDVDNHFSIEHLNNILVNNATKKFIGRIKQKPPVYSAIRVKGERAYNLARKDVKVEMNAREVEIKDFIITKIDLPFVEFKVHCSKGTYIRSLAYDFGKELNTGAYLYKLRRTEIGDFSIDDALVLNDFIAAIDDYAMQLES